MKAIVLSAVLVGVSLVVMAGETEITASPGYFDLGSLEAEYGEPETSIRIEGALLRLVSAVEQDDPAAEAVLRNLKSIRVNAYDTAGNPVPAQERMQTFNNTLTEMDWEPVVTVRKPEKQVDIYVKTGQERLYGMTVMSVDKQKAVFINILGDISPEKLAELMESMNFDVDIDLAMSP